MWPWTRNPLLTRESRLLSPSARNVAVRSMRGDLPSPWVGAVGGLSAGRVLSACWLVLRSQRVTLAVLGLLFLVFVPRLTGQTAGQANVALQGYYLGGSAQPLLTTSGTALEFKEFLPSAGLIHGAFEGYGGAGFHTGTSFFALEKAPILGWHWDFVGGDFQFSAKLNDNPFTNIYTPDISAQGVRIAMKRANRSFQFFSGQESILAGPRIAFRTTMPQQVLGGSYQEQLGTHWQFGVRFLHLSTDVSALNTGSIFFIPGHVFQSANSLNFQSSYRVSSHLKFYGETGYSLASSFTTTPVGQEPISLTLGSTWDTDKCSLRGNYVRQSTTYLPLLGYFVGDRQGPFAEGHYRVKRQIDIYGSAGAYSNNLENNPQLPSFNSLSETLGTSLILPRNFYASASLSILNLKTNDPSQPGKSSSDNLQWNASLSRSIRRHHLRMSLIDMKLNTNAEPQTQRLTELEDTFNWKHLVAGGAIQMQNSRFTESRNTFFFRGSIQANMKRLSVYCYVEKGNDLVNRSIFSTNAYSSTTAGMSTPIRKGWNLQLEAFRNTLNTALNPENIFLFPNGGANLAATQLASFNRWSTYFRVGKQFHWGQTLPGGSEIEQYAALHAPLVGTIRGSVIEQALAGARPAANVAISLDNSRSVSTDATGRYVFTNVPEGRHEVALDMERLPTDYEPGATSKALAIVEPRGLVRADFGVIRLMDLEGTVVAPAGVQLEGMVIRLADTKRYTTPEQDGSFSFYNLREGEYEMVLDVGTLPEGFLLATPASMKVSVSADNHAAPVTFELKVKPEDEKPVRKILEKQIQVGPPSGSAEGGDKRPNSSKRAKQP